MPSIILDFDPPQPDAPDFCGDPSNLVYFLSFAYAGRFGAQHELSLLALALQTECGISLKPLLTFADREVEEAVDTETLEAAWQDPRPLAECCFAVVEAIDRGPEHLQAAVRDYPGLLDRMAELGGIAAWAERRGARIRITFSLTDTQ